MIDARQSPDHLFHIGQTVLHLGEPYLIASVEPKPRTSWFLGWLNNDQQAELHPVEVVVGLERFDGMPR